MRSLESFFTEQLAVWETARKNYRSLEQLVYREIKFDTFNIRIQFNPDRIQSATASIDPEALKKRKCFLCRENLPPEQQSIDYNTTFDIRVNPYPIFTRHFTVPAKKHIPQLISPHFGDMLSLAFDFQEYTVFYNGPKSGASAPDHLHFQLSPRNHLPLENEAVNSPKTLLKREFYPSKPNEKSGKPDAISIETIVPYLRKNLIIRSANKELLLLYFHQLTHAIGEVTENDPEPMMNLFVWYERGEWWVVIFPRRKHRPWQFFAEGADRILFSPGCADFAGLVISPRKADFDRYDVPLLNELFGQLTLDDVQWERLKIQIGDITLTEHNNI